MLMHQVTEEELDVYYNVNVKGTFEVLKRLSNSFLNKVRVVMLSLLFLRLAWEGILISRFTTRQRVHKQTRPGASRLSMAGTKSVLMVSALYCKTSLTRAFYDDKNFNNMFVESIPL